ncbi:MAG: tetratricopeptide repeat protein [bacterium]
MDWKVTISLLVVLLLATQPAHAGSDFLSDTQPLTYLGGLDRLAIGDTPEARKLFQKTLRRDTNHAGSLTALWKIIRRQKGFKEANEFLFSYLTKHPSASVFASLLSQINVTDRKRLTLLSKVGKLGNLGVDLRIQKLSLLFKFERIDLNEAMNRVERLLESNPNHPNLLVLKFELLLEKGELKKCKRTVRKMIRHFPGRPEGYRGMSIVHIKSGNHKQAQITFQRYKALANDDINWKQFKAKFE